MTAGGSPRGVADVDAIEMERARWYELIGLVRALSPAECLEPGYYRDPAWSVRDLFGHVGTWLARRRFSCSRSTPEPTRATTSTSTR